MPITGVIRAARNPSHAGTKNSLDLVINRDGEDLVNGQIAAPGPAAGKARFFGFSIGGPDNDMFQYGLTNSSVRLGIRGDDALVPDLVFMWSEPLLAPYGDAVAIETAVIGTLSTDPSEGYLTLPIKTVSRGDDTTSIRRLMLIVRTDSGENDGTDGTVRLRVTSSSGQQYVSTHFPNTPSGGLQRGETDIFFLPVIEPFTREFGLVISFEAMSDDMWQPITLFLFGLDTIDGRPNAVVTLAEVWSWYWKEYQPISTQTNEGSPLVTIASVRG